jgi:acetoin utilization deacetylase AcuC-like enzyme
MATMRIFFTPRQVAADGRSVLPEPAKPAAVVASWQALPGLAVEVFEPRPCTQPELSRVHSPSYVRGLLRDGRSNGFGALSPQEAQTLPWVVGSFLSAARHAVRTGRPAASPTTNFGLAGYDRGCAFSAFNGLLVAACALQAEGLARRVAIFDGDQHFGIGTAAILARLALPDIAHHSFGARRVRRLDAEGWLAALPGQLDALLAGADVLLFQAAVDPHVEDPMGGTLTTDQLARRDHLVFSRAKALGVPVAWNLGGGYQTPLRRVLDLHDQTALACQAVYG